jgi:hypothetical protein
LDTFIQIITLQNPTFNGWAWGIGTVLLLIGIGLQYEKNADDSIIAMLVALFWPIFLAVSIMMGIIAFPVWVGVKINKHLLVK